MYRLNLNSDFSQHFLDWLLLVPVKTDGNAAITGELWLGVGIKVTPYPAVSRVF
jgi:hypothetical protein